MKKEQLVELLLGKKNRDYTYNVLFFLIFAFFVFAAIRPNLVTAFSLQQQLQELKLKNVQADEKVLKIVSYQYLLTDYRDTLSKVDIAVPSSIEISKIVSDLRTVSRESNLELSSFSIDSVNFIEEKNSGTLYTINANISTSGSLSELQTLIKGILNQLRLKNMDSVSLTRSGESTFDFSVVIKSYYL